MSEFKDTLLKSANGEARLSEAPKSTPWDKFLNTLDAGKVSDAEAMTLFAKTLAKSSSDWKDSNGNTLLMHMASRGRLGIVKRLIRELYANVNATNKDGTTALHMAARSGFMSVCAELMDAQADPCKKDQNGSTAAMLAKDKGHTEIATFLGKEESSRRLWMAAQTFRNQK